MKSATFLVFLISGILILIFTMGAYKLIGGVFLLGCTYYVVFGVLRLGKEADGHLSEIIVEHEKKEAGKLNGEVS